MATHSGILAWEIPWTEEPGGLQNMGLQESDTTECLNQHPPQSNICPLYLSVSKYLLIELKLFPFFFFEQKCDSQGMVDPGEKISATLKREFGEEALNSLQKSSAEKRELQEKLHKLFNQEHLVVRNDF